MEAIQRIMVMHWNCKMSFFVVAVLITICGMTSANGQTPTIDFVVDLDGVLIFDRISNNAPENKIIFVAGHKYRLADWSGELLQFLSEIPGARVTFYSTGPKGSNVEVLKHIILPNGKTAYDIASDGIGSPRIFDRDLWINTDRIKDLSSLPFSVDLNRAVLIDDQDGNVHEKQWRNFLQVLSSSSTGAYPETGDLLAFPSLGPEIERIQDELPRVAGLIALALKKAGNDRSGFSEALTDLQWEQSLSGTGVLVPKIKVEAIDPKIYQIGRRLLRLRQRNKCADSVLR